MLALTVLLALAVAAIHYGLGSQKVVQAGPGLAIRTERGRGRDRRLPSSTSTRTRTTPSTTRRIFRPTATSRSRSTSASRAGTRPASSATRPTPRRLDRRRHDHADLDRQGRPTQAHASSRSCAGGTSSTTSTSPTTRPRTPRRTPAARSRRAGPDPVCQALLRRAANSSCYRHPVHLRRHDQRTAPLERCGQDVRNPDVRRRDIDELEPVEREPLA